MWNRVSRLLSGVLGAQAGPGRHHRKPRRFRPRLEGLEGRLVPATIVVTTFADVVNPRDGKVSLREAINMANATAAPDTIVLQPGVYRIGLAGAGEDANASGDFDVKNPLTIVGQGASSTAIDGGHLDRLFEVLATYNVGFARLTLRNGGTGQDNGGAVQALTANLRLDACVISGNKGYNGGGISAENGNVTLNGCIVSGNVAAGAGGGISLDTGTLTGRDSVVANNRGYFGGGLVAGTATLTGCTVSGNRATKGGGMFAAVHNNFTLVGCLVSRNVAEGSGGGIDLEKGTLTARQSVVRDNVAGSYGGGINAGTANLTNTTVSGNTAGTIGGGISAGTANLTGSTISGNTASSKYGGGINAAISATLINCTVSGNKAGTFGGGLYAAAANLSNSTLSGNNASDGGGLVAVEATLTNSAVSGNTAAEDAGGLHALEATLIDSTVSRNSAGRDAGGISATTAVLTNSTVSGNTASRQGGGLVASRMELLNATIARNTAFTGGGVYHVGINNPATVRNTIIALNHATGGVAEGYDVYGTFASLGHNLIGDAMRSYGFGLNGDLVGWSQKPLDPKLGPLQDNGGRTQTMALLAGSPAIDAGDNFLAPTTDQRGVARPRDGNGDGSKVVDIGAFER